MGLLETKEFRRWFDKLGRSKKAIVDDRLDRIEQHNHFGKVRHFGGGLAELKFRQAIRVYYSVVTDESGQATLLLLGGDKDGQAKDIKRARKILARETS